LAKKRLRNWAMFLVAASAWTGGIVTAAGATIPTTGVVNGVCYSLVLWKSHAAQMAFGIWYFLSFYVVILLIFVFCYGRILMAVRRQANAMAAHGVAESSTAQIQSKRIQTNVTKTTEHHSSISKKYFPLELSRTLDSLKPTQTTLRPTSQKTRNTIRVSPKTKYFPLELSRTLDSLKTAHTRLRPTSPKQWNTIRVSPKILLLWNCPKLWTSTVASVVFDRVEHHSGVCKNKGTSPWNCPELWTWNNFVWACRPAPAIRHPYDRHMAS